MILDCNDEDVDLLCNESVCTLQLEQHILRSGLTYTFVFLVLKAQVYCEASV